MLCLQNGLNWIDLSSHVSCYPQQMPYFWALLCSLPQGGSQQNSSWWGGGWGGDRAPVFSRSLPKDHVLPEILPLAQPKVHWLTLSCECRSPSESALITHQCTVDTCLCFPSSPESGAVCSLRQQPSKLSSSCVWVGDLGGWDGVRPGLSCFLPEPTVEKLTALPS